MSTTTQLLTAEQLLDMPQEDTWRCELVEGVLIKMSPAGFEHGDIAVNVAAMLWQHVKTHKLGKVLAAETGFKLTSDPDTVLAPDAAFIRQEEFDRLGMTKKFWPGAPDLAAEVMSPDDSVRKSEEKARIWLDHGARMVWVVNPKRRTVSVFRPGAETLVLREGDVLDGQDVVPGFNCRVDEIFT
ncbi:MAG: Uma2 family endonuclease [Acidobacteria bacterium]|nr:Uma2 family endonuclease [Acidobacteriota bacterium]